MKRVFGRWGILPAVIAAAALCVGCSRETINYQVAEAIGTLGMYENNEPVETPRMRQEREQREALEAEEAAFAQSLSEAEFLASSYR